MSQEVRYCDRCSYIFLKFSLIVYATIFWVSLIVFFILTCVIDPYDKWTRLSRCAQERFKKSERTERKKII